MEETRTAVEHKPEAKVEAAAQEPAATVPSCSVGKQAHSPGSVKKVLAALVGLTALGGAGYAFLVSGNIANGVIILALGGFVALRLSGVFGVG